MTATSTAPAATSAVAAPDLVPVARLHATVLDARTGLVRRLTRPAVPTHLPRCLQVACAEPADLGRCGPWALDASVVGLSLWDAAAAERAALAGAVESAAGNVLARRLPRCSHADLVGRGERALDPTTLALYSAEQHATAGFPFRAFEPDLVVSWVRGRSLLDNAPTWVPASLAWTVRPDALGEPEPVTHATLHAAIASGPTRESAEHLALCSLLEADARALVWDGGGCGARVDVGEHLDAVGRGPIGRLRPTFLALDSEFGAPCAAVLVRDRETGYLGFGSAWRSGWDDAVHEALAQALHGLMVAADLDDPGGPLAALGADPRSAHKPWRADRAYLRDYRPDWRDATDPACHLQAYLDPRLADRLEDEVGTWPLRLAPTATSTATEDPLARLARAGIDPVSVELAGPELARTGLHVVRVLAPALYSYAPAAYPFLGGKRMAAARARAGAALRDYPLPC